MEKPLIIFDLFNTLIYANQAKARHLSALDSFNLSKDDITEIMYGVMTKDISFLEQYLLDKGIDRKSILGALEAMNDSIKNEKSNIQLYPETLEVLEELNARDHRVH